MSEGRCGGRAQSTGCALGLGGCYVSLLRAAGALGGAAEEGALHERERRAAQRAAGPQRLHVSAALTAGLLPPPRLLSPTNVFYVLPRSPF